MFEGTTPTIVWSDFGKPQYPKWPEHETNLGPLKCESMSLQLHHLALNSEIK